jgi:hypothetical protein
MFNTNMFNSIKDALNKDEEKSSSKDILRFEPGNTYVVRLLPNVKDLEKTFFRYYVHNWKSFATGQNVSAISPTTFGERDPISEERFRYIRTGSEEEKKKAESIRRTEKWMCNVYVLEDSKTPENKGTIKIIRYGRQLEKIINAAMNEDVDEFGPKIFDLSPQGVNLKIKVEMQGDFPTFTSSRFTSPIDLHLNEQQMEAIYNGVHDLTKIITIKSYDELKDLFATHFNGDVTSRPSTVPSAAPSAHGSVSEAETNSVEALSDADVDELLKDLN